MKIIVVCGQCPRFISTHHEKRTDQFVRFAIISTNLSIDGQNMYNELIQTADIPIERMRSNHQTVKLNMILETRAD